MSMRSRPLSPWRFLLPHLRAALLGPLLLDTVVACNPESCAQENLQRDADAGVPYPLGCYQACETDDGCASSWEVCNRGRCRINPDLGFCADPYTAANTRGDREDCGAYVCDGDTGQCKRSCALTEDCTPGFVCSTDINLCVPGQTGGGGAGGFSQVTPMHPASGCVVTCTANADCEDNEICVQGECLLRTNTCDGDALTDGTADFHEDCAPYACNPVEGRCFSRCLVTEQCVAGASCCGSPSMRCAASAPECE
jgi:hypothetical protein